MPRTNNAIDRDHLPLSLIDREKKKINVNVIVVENLQAFLLRQIMYKVQAEILQ